MCQCETFVTENKYKNDRKGKTVKWHRNKLIVSWLHRRWNYWSKRLINSLTWIRFTINRSNAGERCTFSIPKFLIYSCSICPKSIFLAFFTTQTGIGIVCRIFPATIEMGNSAMVIVCRCHDCGKRPRKLKENYICSRSLRFFTVIHSRPPHSSFYRNRSFCFPRRFFFHFCTELQIIILVYFLARLYAREKTIFHCYRLSGAHNWKSFP